MAGSETAAPGRWRGRLGRCDGARRWSRRALGTISAGSDGERVEVVGEDGPARPGLLTLIALQAAAPEPVAALEVADAALHPDPVAGEAAAGTPRAGLRAPRDEDPLGRGVGELLGGELVAEAAVERDLGCSQPHRL